MGKIIATLKSLLMMNQEQMDAYRMEKHFWAKREARGLNTNSYGAWNRF